MKVNKPKDTSQIEQLLSKFMEGSTTLEEEELLSTFFRTTKNIPHEWDTYRSMFAYFDTCMTTHSTPQQTHNRRWRITIGIAAAAIAAAIFGIWLSLPSGNPHEQAKTLLVQARSDFQKPSTEEPSKSNETEAGSLTGSSSFSHSHSNAQRAKKRAVRPAPLPSQQSSSPSQKQVSSSQTDGKRLIEEALRQQADEQTAIQKAIYNAIVAVTYLQIPNAERYYRLAEDETGTYQIINPTSIIEI